MTSLLERYRNGECEPVWRELAAAADRDRTVLSEAAFEAVMRETFGRVRRNVETIIERLRSIGYPFASEHDEDTPRPPLRPSGADAAFAIDTLRRSYGGCPAAIEWFATIVGRVDLRQSNDVDFETNDPVIEHLGDWDPICFDLDYVGVDIRNGDFEGMIADAVTPFIEFAPDVYHKAGFSGAEGYTVDLPAALVDPVVQERGWTFMTYLRQCISSGGFVGAVVQISDRAGVSLTLYENAFDVSLPEHPIFDLLSEGLEQF